MAKNIDRVVRIVEAAARLIEIEASFNAGKGGKGAAAAKRELKAAYEDYMQHHAQRIV
jgi:isoaspartyl peptidase/L-asparaginase-like protein (Ntn-hydrolase superfamily)